MSGILFFLVLCISPVLIFMGAAFGDYKEEGKLPWRKKKDDGVNSGAKFG